MNTPRHSGYPYDARVVRQRAREAAERRERRQADRAAAGWLTWLLS